MRREVTLGISEKEVILFFSLNSNSIEMPRGRSNVGSSQPVPSTSSQMAPPLSQSQAEKMAATMTTAELNKKVEELVQYLLIMDQKKVPIKKQDINKVVLKDASRALPVVMKKASDRLSQVFGIKVVELQDRLKGSYLLVNSLDKQSIVTWPEMDNAKTSLLTIILSIIYMSGNVVQDGELWQGLKNLGISPDITHETFGDVKRLVTQEFVRQAYLEFTKLPNAEEPAFEVRWGQRAKAETSKMQILKFVSLMYNRDPEQWTTQLQDAKNDMEEASTSA